MKAIFEFAASVSDEIMIDDFWLTDCTCSACDAARQARTVTLAGRTHPATSLRAPNQVGLYLFTDGSWVIENFNDQPVEVELNGRKLVVEARGWQKLWK
ncbi:MAG: hypothetical protein HS113_25215 [Verrucomicrobiales bacterium]|nr:hypothetical protein [Verrucomicrobiales bacterium]